MIHKIFNWRWIVEKQADDNFIIVEKRADNNSIIPALSYGFPAGGNSISPDYALNGQKWRGLPSPHKSPTVQYMEIYGGFYQKVWAMCIKH